VDALLGTNNVTDPDGAVDAIAVTALDTSLGTWQFRLNGAGPWLNVNSALVNGETDELALLLGPTDSIRLLPFGDLHGTLSSAITFRAWDMSEGAPGDYRLVTPGNGGISTGSDTASLTVTPVNDAPTFAPVAGDGIVTLDVGVDDVIRSVLVQPDGRILVAGDSGDTTTSDILIARFLPDGTPDPAWGGTGVVLADPSGGGYDSLGKVVLQPDGKVLVSGTIEGTTTGFDFGVLRFNSDGTPDLTFGTGGVATVNFNGTSLDQVNALVLQPDGKVVLAGFTDAVSVYDFALTRLDANGHLDTSFGTGGIVMTDFGGGSYEIGNTVALQSDGKLVVGGFRVGASRDFALARYNTDGSLDPTFGLGGLVVTDFIGGSYDEIARLAIRPDGTIVVVGLTLPNTPGATYSFATTAYNPDGTLAEPLWHIDYSGADSAGLDLAVQPDGKIVVVGGTNVAGTDDMALFRLNDDLTLSTETGGILNGIPIDINGHVDVAFAAALQTDGKILAAGFTGDGIERNLSLVRLLGSGVMDNHFGGTATPTLGNAVAYTENQPAVHLNEAVRVVDPDLAALNGGAGDYAGASVTLSRQGGANAEDVFGIDTTGAPFNISGNSLRSGTDVFATFTTGSGTISIVFDSSATIATQALVDAVLGRIGYVNSSNNPPAQVTIAWSFSDGNTAAAQGPGGALTAGGTTTVNITPANDAPVLSVPQADQNAAVYSAFSYIVPSNTFTDPDLDTLSYSATGLPAWLSFNPTTRTFNGTPGVGNVGFVDVTVTATDPSLASTSDVFRITVAPAAARVYIEGTDIGGGNRTLTANTTFLGAAPTGYTWTRFDGVNTTTVISAPGASSINVAATDNFALYTVQVTHAGGPTSSGAVDPQAATPPAGILQSTGNPGNDTLPAAPIRAQTFIGYHGLDTITGTNGADWIDGGPDVDSMVGGLGNDTYIAHDALDVIVEAAGGGTDLVMSYVTITLPAEVENLTLVGSNAFDGTGNSLANTLTGNGKVNTIAGLAGNDSVNAGAGDDVVDGGADNDTLNGGDGGDTLLGGTGNDSLLGAAGSDSLDGGENNDTLDGGAAADVLLGGNGNDSLIGGGGNDTLTGGAGVDTLNGGAGNDTLALDNTSIDLIQSFAVVDDTFRLSKSLFPALTQAANTPLIGAAFWSGTAAHDADDRIIYNPGTGALSYDADGNGAGAAVQIATLTGLVGALTQADFMVVA
jgi:uncharacterized delta-60 repeat protein